MKTNKYTTVIITFGLAMIATSIYLTVSHYSTSPSLCNFSSFFNCSKAAQSPLSNIVGVPISVFGILSGIMTILFATLNKAWIKQFIYISVLNSIGCLFLGLYSILILKGLCPFCTLYYVLSWLSLYFIFISEERQKFYPPHFLQVSAHYVVVFILTLAISIGMGGKSHSPKVTKAMGDQLYEQFLSYEKLPAPKLISPMTLLKDDKPFAQHKVRILLFSDFECPACRALLPTVELLVEKFKQEVGFLYYPYPLDQACNPLINRPFHEYACKAAYIAYCKKENFYAIHDELYHHQSEFRKGWLSEYIKKNNLESCVNSPKTKEKIVELLGVGNSEYKITSTPTMIINGVKIEGVYPKELLVQLIEQLLKRE